MNSLGCRCWSFIRRSRLIGFKCAFVGGLLFVLGLGCIFGIIGGIASCSSVGLGLKLLRFSIKTRVVGSDGVSFDQIYKMKNSNRFITTHQFS